MSDPAIYTEEAEARLNRLEENLWFQEKKLEELDGIVRDLQQEQSLLIRKLEQTRQLISHLRDVLDSHSQTGQSNKELPPHYQQSK